MQDLKYFVDVVESMHSGGASLFGLKTAETGQLLESPQYQPPPSLNTSPVQITACATSQLDRFNALLHVYHPPKV